MDRPETPPVGRTAGTALGLTAIVCWSTAPALMRTSSEQLGPVTAGAAVFLTAGLVGCGWLALSRGGLGRAFRLPRAYLLGCGGLFVLYELCIYLAVGLAATHRQVLEVGIINYLWPGLTLAFSVPILKRRARLTLLPGVLIAFAGVALARFQGRPVGLSGPVEGPAYAPYLLALVAAVSWGLYSNLSRRWAGTVGGTGVPLFFLAAGVLFCLVRLAMPDPSHWSLPALREVAFLAIVPHLLGYTFWDLSMRHGRMVLVAAFSYLTPVLATLIACAYLGVWPGVGIWAGCALVVAGAVICKWSVGDEESEDFRDDQ